MENTLLLVVLAVLLANKKYKSYGICEELEIMINKKEDETLEALKKQKAYRGMHKDKKRTGISSFFYLLFGG